MLRWPIEPMRAASAGELTATPAAEQLYEPKWDGFRTIAWARDDGVRLQSRNGKDLSSRFPELCAVLTDFLPLGVVLDGELIIWDQDAGRTSFELLQRRFRVGRRIGVEGAEHPAHLVAFDVLRDARGRELLDQPLSKRRRVLQRVSAGAGMELTLCPQTSRVKQARSWLEDWSAAGIEGIVVKPAAGPYVPGKAGWIKVKARQTEEYIVGGVTGTVDRPGSLLLGRLDQRGVLRLVGQTHRVRADQRVQLARLRPMLVRGDGSGHPWPCPLPAAWAADLTERAAVDYVPVEPVVVVEVEADLARDGTLGRLRHRCRFLRHRPDLSPEDVAQISRVRPLVSSTV